MTVQTYPYDKLTNPNDTSYLIIVPQSPSNFSPSSTNPDGKTKSKTFIKFESLPTHPYVPEPIEPPSVLSVVVGAIQ